MQQIITENPDYFFLFRALHPENIYDYNKIFTSDNGLAGATDGRRIHIIPHRGLLQPDSLYTPIPMSDSQMMLAWVGKDAKVPMWEIINTELRESGRTPVPLNKLPEDRFNPQYIRESIPNGVACVSDNPGAYLLIEGSNEQKAIILPLVERRYR